MSKSTILLLAALALAGCSEKAKPDPQAEIRDRFGKAAINSSKISSTATEIEFQCTRSMLGQCHVVVFANECDKPDVDAPDRVCKPRTLEAFAMPEGAVRKVAIPAGEIQKCLSHTEAPKVPECAG